MTFERSREPDYIETDGLPVLRNIEAIKILLSRQVVMINSSPLPDDPEGIHFRAHESQENDTWIEVFSVNGERYATHAVIFVPGIEKSPEARSIATQIRKASLIDELHHQGIHTEYLNVLQDPIEVIFEPENRNHLRENMKPRVPKILSSEFLGILARTAITGKIETW